MNMNEVWKEVKGYEGLYEVSSLGNVRNAVRGRLLRTCKHNTGYLSVVLYKNGTPRRFNVHRLVAIAFLSNEDGYEFVNHIDEDKTNNAVDNLEWCTREHNMRHGTVSERISQKRGKGSRKGRPVAQIGDDGSITNVFESIAKASRETGAARNSIWGCCNGVHIKANGSRWAYLT